MDRGPEASDTRNQLGHPPNRSRRNREPQPAHHDAKGRCTLQVELCWSAQRQSVAVPLPNSRQRPTFGGERSCSLLVGAPLTACPPDDRIKAYDVSRSSATRRGHPPRSFLALEIPGERLLRLQYLERETIPSAVVACHYGSQAADAVRTGARIPYQPTG